MNKKIVLIILFFLSLLVITGCGTEKQEEKKVINESTEVDELKTIGEYEYETTFKCDALSKNIRYFNYGNSNWFVTDDNEVYVFSLYQLFSNGTNCKKINDKFDDIIFNDTEYNWNSTKGKYIGETVYYNEELEQVSVDTQNYLIVRDSLSRGMYKEIIADLAAIKDSDYTRYRKVNGCTAFGTKNDNNIYIFNLNPTLNYETLEKSIISNEEVIYSVPKDETILDFYYSSKAYAKGCYGGSSIDNIEEDIGKKFIITDKAYYRPLLKDESCLKYQDVECEYTWKKDEELSKIKDNILYRDESIIITKSGRIYNNYNFIVD
ncbi:MAG: hypothetical protein E7159_01270 [Firmicutes bacterium]|nr:hypothetical protein [Bacillota bacterium]